MTSAFDEYPETLKEAIQRESDDEKNRQLQEENNPDADVEDFRPY